MQRCSLHALHRRHGPLACCAAALLALATALPATAQTVAPQAGTTQRNFPPAALRGTLVITDIVQAQLNGKAVRMAPGMRLFSADNHLLALHTMAGQRLRVNYVLEASTGMLLTAWVLNSSEAAAKRAGDDTIEFNFKTESDKPNLR
ncbi:hypothetical protein [Paracidovorax wautersii]|uniref:Uncharacterized protein n=1 Tax=Paracidovorax wautersii TaxID=1177982 RepID=A0ABU1I6U0_9BURK|nr:hypothetical protein [Paracidovorax wautersii]MDR6212780.1 hypothetical protein [Paracidovorax wautersii]